MDRQLPTVSVLLSTHNGSKYIREQIDSILKQRDVRVRLFVRDDSSSDDTVTILKEYVSEEDGSLLRNGEQVGPGESFMRLVYAHADDPDTEYYAFADQDDIWEEDKLAAAVRLLEAQGNQGPLLYSSNQFLYEDGENKGKRYTEKQRTDLISHMTRNTVSGCTFVFNKELARTVAGAERPDPRILRYRLHDAWLMLVAILCGDVIYDEEPHMLYRIHEENTVGVKEVSGKEKLGKLGRFFSKRDDANIRMITAQELLRLFPDADEEKRKILRLYANYQNCFSDKKKLAFNREIRENCLERPVIFTLKVFLNFV